MRILKVIGKGLAGLLALILLFMGGTYLSDPIKFGRFYSAFIYFPVLSTKDDWWTPQALVKGVENPAPLPVARSDELTIHPQAFDDIEAWLEDKNSIGLIVAHRGKIQYEKYWPGFDASTISDTASMHKSLMGLMFGFALRDGDIPSLDEPVKTYLTEWANDRRGDITIRQMMEHTSGLNIDPFSMNPFSRTAELFYGSNIEKLVLDTELAEDPGTRFQYASVNSQLLGIILERATGMKLNEYESKHIWQPLGAKDANLVLDREGGMARTFCCFRVEMREWIRFGNMLINGGKVGEAQIIPADWLQEWQAPSAKNPQYGKQVWRGTDFVGDRTYHDKTSLIIPHNEPMLADDLIYFDGANGNRLYVIPSKELVIVRTGNFNMNWEESFIPNTLIRNISNVIPASAQKGDLPPIPPEDELFWWRYANLPDDIFEPPMDWYEPYENIVGVDDAPFFDNATEQTIDVTALNAAETYAKNHNSTAFVVMHKGKIVRESYWDGYSRDKTFSSHSMNKTVTALAIGLALDEGLIASVDDPVEKYLPRAKGTPFGGRTIRHLLTMSSGVEHLAPIFEPNAKVVQLAWGTNTIDTALTLEMDKEPETEFNHENANPLLLGAIVSEVSGQRYADFVSEMLWQPLQARTATLFLDQDGGTPHTDCCLLSKPTTWIRIGEMFRNGGRVGDQQIISEAYLKEMLTPSKANPNYGFQIWLGTEHVETRMYREGQPFGNTHSELFAADDVIYMDGYGHKRVWIIPSKELVIMRLGFIDRTFDEAFIPNTIIAGVQ